MSKRYEYRTLVNVIDMEHDSMGDEGWLLVAVVQMTHERAWFYFVRELREG